MSDHIHLNLATMFPLTKEKKNMHKWTSIEGLYAGAKSLTDHAMGTLTVLRDATSSLESAIAGIAIGEPLETLLPTVRRLEMIADLIENLGTDLGNAADRFGDTVAKDIPGSA